MPVGFKVTTCVKEQVVRSQRYSLPSSLGITMLAVAGSTRAVLMHHSRTALACWLVKSVSRVGPGALMTAFITISPLDEEWGSTIVSLGSRMAIWLTPSPPSETSE